MGGGDVFYPTTEECGYSEEQQNALDAVLDPHQQHRPPLPTPPPPPPPPPPCSPPPPPPSFLPPSPQLKSQTQTKTVKVSLMKKKTHVKRIGSNKAASWNYLSQSPTKTSANNHRLVPLNNELTVSLPVEQFKRLVSGRKITMEHNYAAPSRPTRQLAPLVLSMALRCCCGAAPLRVCHHCHSMFHSSCSPNTACCSVCASRTSS